MHDQDGTARSSSVGGFFRTFGAVVGVLGFIVSVGVAGYVVLNYRDRFDQTEAIVKRIDSALSEYRSADGVLVFPSSTSSVGVAGPKGDPGPQGPQGPKGDAGQVDEETLSQLVEKAVATRIAAIQANGGIAATATAVDPQTFNLAACTTVQQLQAQPTAEIRVGFQLCAADGTWLMEVMDYSDSDEIGWMVQGRKTYSCGLHRECDWKVKGTKSFLFDRVREDEKGYAYLIRFR